MIETIDDIQKFQVNNAEGDLILHMFPVHLDMHPVKNIPCVLFIKNVLTQKIYYYAINHPDSDVTDNSFLSIIRSIKNRKFAIDKKSFDQLLPDVGVLDLNLCGFLTDNTVVDILEYTSSAHDAIRRNSKTYKNFNRIVPILKHKEVFSDLCDDIEPILSKFNFDSAYKWINDDVIVPLTRLELNGLFVDEELFMKHFELSSGGMVHSQYNIYTSTGRPSNSYNGVNYAALNHTDGSRNCFVSRYGKDGCIVVVDYTAFHPRIICKLTNYEVSSEVDMYEYLAKLYFQKKVVDEDDIKNAKQLTFRQLYDRIDKKYSHIKYFSNLELYIAEQWKFFRANNYVLTPFFGRKITDKHIKDPSPSKILNYLLQAAEGEIAIPRINQIHEYLKHKKTVPVLYTYDAIMYDFNKHDGFDTLTGLQNIMSMDGYFPLKTYMGTSYGNVKLI